MNHTFNLFLASVALWAALSWTILFQNDVLHHLSPSPATVTFINNETSFIEYSNTYIPTPDSFSACIMFKDDTHRLIEWLAYHYHVLPLRQVVIGVDQGATEYPIELAKRYENRIKITLWPRTVFAPDHEIFTSERKKQADGANQYIRRQTLFLRKCALHLHDQGRGWTIFTDPDEYLLFNYPAGETPPSTVRQEYRNIVMPSISEPGCVWKFLQQQQQQTGSYSNSCITVPRLLFSSREYNDTQRYTHTPLLDTLRYRSHADRNDYKSNRQAKNLLDLSRFTSKELVGIKNVHRMVADVCWNSFIRDDQTLLKINHYMGSKKAFFHRQDDRDAYGRKGNYDQFANINAGTDDTITSWYNGFVKTEGQDVVETLLQGAGEIL